MKDKENPKDYLYVDIVEAKPNPLFTEEQRQSVRFLRYNRSIPCAECGKRRRIMWTLLVSFHAQSLTSFGTPSVMGAHPPLTPVCGDHPLSAAPLPPEKPKRKEKPRESDALPRL
jgi:hypothetical protein